jgi:hypothetical protein
MADAAHTHPTHGHSPAAPRVVVHPMPKVLFFYLTWLASLAFGIVAQMAGDSQPAHLGAIWIGIFAFNLMVISFDFTEVTSFAVAFLILAVVFAGIAFGFLGKIGAFLGSLQAEMNPAFYFTIFGLFTVIYVMVFIRSRFEYWEFRQNEVLHRKGVFGEIKRYSTEDLRWFKEVPDVLERILLRSGRMVLTTPREPAPMVIEHVIGIGTVDDRIAEILGEKRVVIK